MTSRHTTALAAGLLLGAGLWGPAAALAAPADGGGGKVTICHRTHSTTNPYRRITVSISAVNGSSANDHSLHAGPVFDAARTYAPNEKVWGDVIPDRLNWTVAGQALYGGARCGAMTSQAFYDTEREAGVPREQVLADLAEQEADGDDPASFSVLVYSGSDPSVGEGPAASPSPSASPSPGASPSASPAPDSSPSASPSADPSPSLDLSPSPSPVASPDPLPDPSPSPSPVASPDPLPDPSPDPLPDLSPSPSGWPASPAPELSPSPAASPDASPAVTPFPTPSSVSPAPEAPAPTAAPSSGVPSPAASAGPGALPEPDPPSTPPAPTAAPGPAPAPGSTPAPGPTSDPVPAAPPVDAAPDVPTSQTISGEVWLDLDRDGVHDPAEPGLPDLEVDLVRAGALRQAMRTTAAQVVAGAMATSRTDATGAVSFRGLPAGSYDVVAAPPAGLSVTRSSDGRALPTVSVGVPAGGTGRTWVGLVGDGSVTAAVRDGSGRPVTGDVLLRWSGADTVLRTADDVLMTLPAVDGRLAADGLPAGGWVVEQIAGQRVSLPLLLARGQDAVLTLTGAQAAADAVEVRGSSLPRTGASSATAIGLAGWLLAAGGLLVTAGRRRTA